MKILDKCTWEVEGSSPFDRAITKYLFYIGVFLWTDWTENWYNKNMNELEEKYQKVLEETKNNKDILGLFLGGSRGKSSEFLTKDSDMDVYVILSDNFVEKMNKITEEQRRRILNLKIRRKEMGTYKKELSSFEIYKQVLGF